MLGDIFPRNLPIFQFCLGPKAQPLGGQGPYFDVPGTTWGSPGAVQEAATSDDWDGDDGDGLVGKNGEKWGDKMGRYDFQRKPDRMYRMGWGSSARLPPCLFFSPNFWWKRARFLFRSFEPFPKMTKVPGRWNQALGVLGARLVKINPEHQVYALAYMVGLTQSRFSASCGSFR